MRNISTLHIGLGLQAPLVGNQRFLIAGSAFQLGCLAKKCNFIHPRSGELSEQEHLMVQARLITTCLVFEFGIVVFFGKIFIANFSIETNQLGLRGNSDLKFLLPNLVGFA